MAPITIIGSGLAGYTVARELRKLDDAARRPLVVEHHAGLAEGGPRVVRDGAHVGVDAAPSGRPLRFSISAASSTEWTCSPPSRRWIRARPPNAGRRLGTGPLPPVSMKRRKVRPVSCALSSPGSLFLLMGSCPEPPPARACATS